MILFFPPYIFIDLSTIFTFEKKSKKLKDNWIGTEIENSLTGSIKKTKFYSNQDIFRIDQMKKKRKLGADAIKKFTPSIGISYLGV